LVTEKQPWTPLTDNEGQKIPRRAGINAFGFGGVNAHLILEEYEPPKAKAEMTNQESQLIVLSARNEDRLKAYAQQMVDFLEKQPDIPWLNLAYTLQVGREAMTERLAMVVESIDDLLDKLTQYVQGQTEIKGL
jgi:acyl transferase domain-containing protein